ADDPEAEIAARGGVGADKVAQNHRWDEGEEKREPDLRALLEAPGHGEAREQKTGPEAGQQRPHRLARVAKLGEERLWPDVERVLDREPEEDQQGEQPETPISQRQSGLRLTGRKSRRLDERGDGRRRQTGQSREE